MHVCIAPFDRIREVTLTEAEYAFLRKKQAEIEARKLAADPPRKGVQSVQGFTRLSEHTVEELVSKWQAKEKTA